MKVIMYQIDEAEERKEIEKRYQQILQAFRRELSEEEKQDLHKAYLLSVSAHENMRRKSGEPYIYHPLAVAYIVVHDIGLGSTSAICALLHDVVEDTDYTLVDIEQMFGVVPMRIIDGLTKIDEIFDQSDEFSAQAENFKKMLFTLSEDVRVILIKLADRLHNMRTLDSMKSQKQLKIASETINVYAPLAHRLGLYTIKSELEDLSFKYTDPQTYESIASKIKDSEVEREELIKKFIAPIRQKLDDEKLSFSITGRVKSICSIWGKMQKKGVPFEEVFDLFAVRIIVDAPVEKEKSECYRAYAAVTHLYRANPSRLRDWIAIPKVNGYEALHTTVMSKQGKWVEVQIRSKRMDEIAEKGYAAHWRYKNEGLTSSQNSGLDEWLSKIRDMLENTDANTFSFLNDFRINFFNDEIYVYTPKGEVRTLPKGATVLDFAFTIHSEIGFSVIGAKVNHRLEALNYPLKSGDQVEIISSKNQSPTEEWLSYIVTARARQRLKAWLKEKYVGHYEIGKNTVKDWLMQMQMELSPEILANMLHHFGIKTKTEFYYKVAKGEVDAKDVYALFHKNEKANNWFSQFFNWRKSSGNINLKEAIQEQVKNHPETLLLGKDVKELNYVISDCCKPIPGDDVVGFIRPNKGIEVHRTNCSKATELMSQYGNRIVKAKWKKDGNISFLTGLRLHGFDRQGLVKDILDVISQKHNINIRSVGFSVSEGIFEGKIMLYIQNTEHLNSLIKEVRGIESVEKIERVV